MEGKFGFECAKFKEALRQTVERKGSQLDMGTWTLKVSSQLERQVAGDSGWRW